MRQLRLTLPWLRPSPAPNTPRDDAPLDGITLRWRQLRHAGPARRVAPHLAAAQAIRKEMKDLPADSINAHALRERLCRGGLDANGRRQALAYAARAARSELGLTPHDVQLAAAHALLCGTLAEMATGEGKTLVVALAAAVGAFAGHRVHVVTANDYLVARDAADMAPLYARLGLRVATVCQGDTAAARQSAYSADITYVTARELVFDALRDGVVAPREGQPLLDRTQAFIDPVRAQRRQVPDFDMAIIDEADSVLLDEARVPLVLSRPQPGGVDAAALQVVLARARSLQAERDFIRETDSARIELTTAGRDAAAVLGENRRARESRLVQALAALHVYQRDRDYVVKDEKVHIVDVQSGRIAEGRAWSQELHRFIELKEDCPLGHETVTAAQTTYQRFFPRYAHLCGISGTLAEAAGELAAVYDRAVVRIPTHQAVVRRMQRTRVFASRDGMWRACLGRAIETQAVGRALLIGTDSVHDSRRLSARLSAAGVEHEVLDALQDASEAAIVERAGQPGRVTVATRMAGRGTDIRLDDAVRAAGGLHVICCQHNSTARTDRQLIGRGARQGDPGSAEHFRALDADPIETWLSPGLRRQLAYVPQALLAHLFSFRQRQLAATERRLRILMMRADQQRHRRTAYRGASV